MLIKCGVTSVEGDPQASEGLFKKPFDILWILNILNILNQKTVKQNRQPGLVQKLAVAAMLLMGVCLPIGALAQSPAVTTPFQITSIRVQNGNPILPSQGGGPSTHL